MKQRQIEEMLAQVALPPPPDRLRQRIMERARRIGCGGVLTMRLTWYRLLEAAATLAILAGASGRAY